MARPRPAGFGWARLTDAAPYTGAVRSLATPPPAKHPVTVALAAVSVLVIHQLAYLAAYPTASVRAAALGDHRHLAVLWSVVGPLSVVAAVTFVLRQVRQLNLVGPLVGALPRRRLALLSAGLFLAQESIEAAVLGHDGGRVLLNRAVYVGLGLAPLVAWAVERLLRRASELVARWFAPPRPTVPSARLAFAPLPLRPWSDRRAAGSSSRGPPG